MNIILSGKLEIEPPGWDDPENVEAFDLFVCDLLCDPPDEINSQKEFVAAVCKKAEELKISFDLRLDMVGRAVGHFAYFEAVLREGKRK